MWEANPRNTYIDVGGTLDAEVRAPGLTAAWCARVRGLWNTAEAPPQPVQASSRVLGLGLSTAVLFFFSHGNVSTIARHAKAVRRCASNKMWFSWYETRACLNSILITCANPGTKKEEGEGVASHGCAHVAGAW